MISATNSLTFTATGQPYVHVGFAQARQRIASLSASAGSNPRFTSWKLCARTAGSCSRMCCRGIFIRSLLGTVLGIGDVLPCIGHRRFGFLHAARFGRAVNQRELFVLVLLESLDRFFLF